MGHPELNKPLHLFQEGKALVETLEVPYKVRYSKPKVPVCDPDAITPLYSRLSVEDLECQTDSSSPTSRPATEEYRILGLDWHTRGIRNSCHLDGFLSAFVRTVRQTQGNLLREIVCQDQVADALLQIAQHTLRAKNLIDSEAVKDMWLKGILGDDYQKPIDVRGLETFSIFQHMLNHAGLNVEVKCPCGATFIWTPYLRLTKPQEVYLLQNLLSRNEADYTHVAKCATCKQKRDYQDYQVFSTNWCFIAKFAGEDEVALNLVPKQLIVPDSDATSVKTYKLAYLSYTQSASGLAIGHQVSLHNIHNWWYLHDGMDSPAFKKWPNYARFDKGDARLTAVVYFLDPKYNSLATKGPPKPIYQRLPSEEKSKEEPEKEEKDEKTVSKSTRGKRPMKDDKKTPPKKPKKDDEE